MENLAMLAALVLSGNRNLSVPQAVKLAREIERVAALPSESELTLPLKGEHVNA